MITPITPIPTHRLWLKELAARCEVAWQTAVLPSSEEGQRRIETRHTIYVLEDSECIEVVRRDDGSPVSSMQGMRLVGWYYDVDGDPRMASMWRPGARAVLWRPRRSSELESVIALTSPTFGFVHVGRRSEELTTRRIELDEAPVSGVRPTPRADELKRPNIAAHHPATQSMARVHVGF
ncbi:hypothetical protein BH09MYX1_BH09MYX1_38370 [soil metagenome]